MSDATPPVDVSVKPPQRFRRLRIGVSLFFGVLTVALCVLWVRSYVVFDRLAVPLLKKETFYGYDILLLVSFKGRVTGVSTINADSLKLPFLDSGPTDEDHWGKYESVWQGKSFCGFGWTSGEMYLNVPTGSRGYHSTGLTGRSYAGKASGYMAPYWALVALAGMFAALPLNGFPLSPRFSLRTLLVATTLVAMVLGLVCYASR